jgi:hypothetical protein
MEVEKIYELVDRKTDEIRDIVREQKTETDLQISIVHKRLDKHEAILQGVNGVGGLRDAHTETTNRLHTLETRFEADAPKVKEMARTRDRISWLGTLITAGITFAISGITFIFLLMKLLNHLKNLGVIK